MARRLPRRDNLVEALLHACRQDPVLGSRNPGRVVVGLSGGPDSTALLHGLARVSSRLRVDLLAVHVDHRLRPGSGADATVAASLCAELGIPLEVRRPRVRGHSEEAARRARYAALESVAGRAGARTIAVGHTADDQAETVLLHLVRGTGLEGLAAMSVREGRLFRPLLGVWRSQVEAYCRAQALRPARDPTNDDPAFTRNRVRRELIPVLEEAYNPQVKVALVRLAAAARAEHDVTVEAAQRWLRRHPRPLPRPAFNRLPDAVRVEVLRQAWSQTAALPRPAGSAARLGQALRVIAGPGPGIVQLGGALVLDVRGSSFDIRSERLHSPLMGS